MIERKDILSIPFLKKSPFTGSLQGMRYRMERWVPGEGEGECLKVTIWEAPYSFEVTDSEKWHQEFPFAEEGILQAVDWMNQAWESQRERWTGALERW